MAVKERPMPDVYQRLAKALDRLPHGYPATDSGVELEILRRIFRPEDAELTLKLKPIPETAAAIARRLRRPVEEMRATLDRMAERGQIHSFRLDGRHVYAQAPFIVGIYEYQLKHLDREMAELFEAYAPTLLATLGGAAPALARVVPVKSRIEARAEVLPTDDLRAMLGRAHSFRIAQCICRREQELLGSPCSHTQETCLSFSSEAEAYRDVPDWGREISRDEALELLDRFEEEGLVHCTYNVQREPFFVCNCCSCCCGFLRGLRDYDAPFMLARSNWQAVIDADGCSVCGVCADERCPVAAIVESDGGYAVLSERCIGCGVCAVDCPTDAIQLVPRPEEERQAPPKTVVNWSLERLDHRHGRLKGLAMRGWLAWEGLKVAAARRLEGPEGS
jgi:Pyruvate/2-oxoacid:ferredoxin oxidoreductase delta subunit